MNLFILSTDPIKCAQRLHDRHVISQIGTVESLIATWLSSRGIETLNDWTHLVKDRILPPGLNFGSHPLTVWALESNNIVWLADHLKALMAEYLFRFGKSHDHSGLTTITWQIVNKHAQNHHMGFAPDLFVRIMPDKYKTAVGLIQQSLPELTESDYQTFYAHECIFSDSCKWTRRQVPSFLTHKIWPDFVRARVNQLMPKLPALRINSK